MNEILGVVSVRAGHGIRAVSNFQSRDAYRTLNEFLVLPDEPFHRRKALFRVVGWDHVLVLVLEIGFKQQAACGSM